MKKIKLKLNELTNPQVLSNEQMKTVTGGGFCYTGMSCEFGGTCYSTPAGNNCVCGSEWGYGQSAWCG